MTSPNKSVLVIGSTGRTGLELLRKLASDKYEVHAFARSASKLPKEETLLCASVVEGDARNTSDIREALVHTQAGTVILSVGNGDSTAPTDVRTATAQALASVLKENPEFSDIRVVVVSSVGAGGCQIKFGLGMGKALSFILRNVIKDHNGQEAAFVEDRDLQRRTMIVRASSLTDGKTHGKVVTFGDKDKTPSGHIDREDVASFIVEEISRDDKFGRAVNITAVKK